MSSKRETEAANHQIAYTKHTTKIPWNPPVLELLISTYFCGNLCVYVAFIYTYIPAYRHMHIHIHKHIEWAQMRSEKLQLRIRKDMPITFHTTLSQYSLKFELMLFWSSQVHVDNKFWMKSVNVGPEWECRLCSHIWLFEMSPTFRQHKINMC